MCYFLLRYTINILQNVVLNIYYVLITNMVSVRVSELISFLFNVVLCLLWW
jgi:hypothetical protein